MISALVTPPATRLLTLAEAKAHLRVTSSAEDDYITSLALSAEQYLDAAHGILGAALITQTWKVVLPNFPSGNISLPISPAQSVTSVTYFDTDNVEQTYSAANYSLEADNESARVALDNDAAWPSTYERHDAVTVTYVAGYGDAASDVPKPIRDAALVHVERLYERGDHVAAVAKQNNMTFDALTMTARRADGLF